MKRVPPKKAEEHPELFDAGAHEDPRKTTPASKPPERGAAEPPKETLQGPLPFKLERPLVFLDLEATGLDVREERIVEVAALKLHPDGTLERFVARVNPGVPIPPEATAVHGITDADVQASPRFAELAGRLFAYLSGCDLAGFGVARYDLHLLAQEFKRAGMDFTDNGRRVLDAALVFHKREPRDLTAALKFYCGRDLVGAHGALADCRASLDVFLAQFSRYPDLPKDAAGLHAYLNQSDARYVDGQGRLFWKHGEACFNFGKYRSRTLEEIAKSDPGYLDWLIGEGKSSPELLEIYRKARRGHFPQKPG